MGRFTTHWAENRCNTLASLRTWPMRWHIRTISKVHWCGRKSFSRSIRSCLEMITRNAPSRIIISGDYLNALKRYDEARVHIERAIQIKERAYGTAPIRVADSLTMYGQILMSQSHFDESLRVFERSLAIRRASNSPRRSILLHSIGNLYFNQKRYDLAIEKYIAKVCRCS